MVMMGDNLETGRASCVFGNYIDEALMRAVVGSTMIDLFHTQDHLFSTTAVYYAMGGSFGIQERYEYDAYGKATVMDDGTDNTWFTADDETQSYSTVGNGYTFTGRRQDTLDNAGYSVMYYRARYYDTEMGRFLQRDPLGYVDAMCLYEYVGSAPSRYIDPMGLYMTPMPPNHRPVPPGQNKIKLPDLSGLIGGGTSFAYYAPFPSTPLAGAYIKGSFSTTTGKCCKSGKRLTYLKQKVSLEVGVYAGTKGRKVRPGIKVIENLKTCPEEKNWKCQGQITVAVRLSLLKVSCEYKLLRGPWSCSGGISLYKDDWKTARLTFGGGGSCSRTMIY